jgi:cytochrome c-type protein NapC
MRMADSPEEKKEQPGEQRHFLWRKPYKWYLFWIPFGGMLMFVAGIVFWGGFHTVLEMTNTEAFCISCHEMQDYVYEEYKETIHYKNRTGVRATCPDCHVPKPWAYKIARKIQASNEVFHKIAGTVDTREKFENHRLELAEKVWNTMKTTDSRECRNCHAFEYMDLEVQDASARKKHTLDFIRESGKTCIDCHKGIAHHLPKGYE